METQDQHVDTNPPTEPLNKTLNKTLKESLPDSTPESTRRERTGIWRKRVFGLLVLAAFVGLGILLSPLARTGSTNQPMGIHAYDNTERSRSIHLALESRSDDVDGADVTPIDIEAIVFARTPIDVDFKTWTMHLSDGRHVPLPRTDDLILVSASGQVSSRLFRQRFQLIPILRTLPSMPFDRLQAELARIDPATAEFWQE
jgi:hypothetical protein